MISLSGEMAMQSSVLALHRLMTTQLGRGRGGGREEELFVNKKEKEKCIKKGDWNKASCTE